MKKALTAIAIATTLSTPALAGNWFTDIIKSNTDTSYHYGLDRPLFYKEVERLEQEIGYKAVRAKVWDCNYSKCNKYIATWWVPEKNLYVEVVGGAGAERRWVEKTCPINPNSYPNQEDCDRLARLTMARPVNQVK